MSSLADTIKVSTKCKNVLYNGNDKEQRNYSAYFCTLIDNVILKKCTSQGTF